MILIKLESNRFEVCAVGAKEENQLRCNAVEFLANQPRETAGSAKGFKSLFRRYASHGRRGLTTDNFHEANKQAKIWEFIKGRLRIFCFIDDDNIVILTHGALKKTPKASKKEINQAIAVKEQYLAAKAEGDIETATIVAPNGK